MFAVSPGTASAELYEHDADYSDDLQVSKDVRDLLLWHHRKAIRYVTNLPSGSTTLDLGCFNGFFVKQLQDLGFDAYGIDFNSRAIRQGQERWGLHQRISTSSLVDLARSGKTFDVISMFEVLEHLEDVELVLEQVTPLLRAGGSLIISTPNRNMSWRPPLDAPPHHLSRFTIGSLTSLVRRFGLTPVYSGEQMSTFELVRHFVGLYFRSQSNGSMRGGSFKHRGLTTMLRRGMNSVRPVATALLSPVDYVLFLLGFRYISQIVIARKESGS